MNTPDRPDPDQLLAQVQAEEERAARGKLKIFFGASAGVGKTFAMLSAAQRQREQGTNVLVGVVETHGRKETEALVGGLPLLPLRDVEHRGRVLKEFDIDGALARLSSAAPQLILIDELAHTNAPGSRHPKRWQDVQELLAAGIDVYTTVNVQHIETLNDVVSGITGIRVWETVPDNVFDEADEVVLVDLPPDDLLQRLKEGKVYLPQQAERAIRNFFRKGNLIALRELALRRTADRVDDEMRAYRREISAKTVWETRDALLVCIGSGAGAQRLVRTGARLASRLEAPWHVIHVQERGADPESDADRASVLQALELGHALGAATATLTGEDAVTAIVGYAREQNLSRLLVGRDHARRWRPWYRSVADRLGHAAPDLDVIQVARSERAAPAPEAGFALRGTTPWPAYLRAFGWCALTTALAFPLAEVVELTNIAMLFLLAVLAVAVQHGRGPAVLAALVGVAAFDFFFVPPRFTFAVADARYTLTFGVMLVVALVTGQLTARFKRNAEIATVREARARGLYGMASDLSAALMPEQIAEVCERFLRIEFGSASALLLTDADDRLQPPIAVTTAEASAPPVLDEGIARWCFDHGEAAGLATDTLPASPLLYLPLKAPMRTRGVLAVAPRQAETVQDPEARRQLETFASLVAIAVERMHYIEVAQNTLVKIESEGLRNSLLSAISHDLRTPLAVLTGHAEAIEQAASGHERILPLAQSLRGEVRRMSNQVGNLLDMARLQAGQITLKREWQPLDEVVGAALNEVEHGTPCARIQVHLPTELPLVEIDTALMQRVLVNLLENALKYAPGDTPIDLAAQTRGDRLEVSVSDRGPGLPAGKEALIFEKFERGARESSASGVGLGLAICRAIVAAHHGTIHGENRPGGGARFVFTLPLGQPPQATSP